jgi:hypothetical protein
LTRRNGEYWRRCLDKGLITSDVFTALFLMAIGSTMLTIPIVTPKLRSMEALIFKRS